MTPLDRHLLEPLDQRVADRLWADCMIGLAEVGRNGEWLRVNPAICHLLEYTQAELLGKTFQDVTDPRDVHADVDMVKALIAGELPSYVMAKRYITKTGRVIWIQLKVVPIHGDSGEVEFFLSQIAPAKDVGVVSEPVVKEQPKATGFGHFVQENWKWFAGISLAVAGFAVAEWVRYQELNGRVDRMEQNDQKILEKLEELKTP